MTPEKIIDRCFSTKTKTTGLLGVGQMLIYLPFEEHEVMYLTYMILKHLLKHHFVAN